MFPIVYIHSGNIPDYLLRSVDQALIYNKHVVLITDSSSEDLKIKPYLIDQFNEGVAEFENIYIHMSTNSISFELICIKRWFLLRNYMNKYNIDVCYYSDSDVMIYDDLNAVYSFYQDFDAAYTMTEYQKNYRWSASACCSFWKRETINRFCDFILELYSSSKIKKLKEKWNYHQQNNIPGGICDMTLLYLFTEEINFYPLSKVMNNFCFDQNMKDDENYFKNEYKFTGNKKGVPILKLVTWKDDKPYGFNTKLNCDIRFIVLTEYAKVLEDLSKQKVSLRKVIKKFIPVSVINKITSIIKPVKKYGWFGDYSTWAEAQKKCTGYDSDVILEKVKDAVLKVKKGEAVYERDSVLFDKIEYSQPLLDVFKMIAHEKEETLNLIDFGGSLGSSFFQNRSF